MKPNENHRAEAVEKSANHETRERAADSARNRVTGCLTSDPNTGFDGGDTYELDGTERDMMPDTWY